jgi:ectoine hydroxylase-related dioxygenase (phytanoyl-CoA dioxygenase family)
MQTTVLSADELRQWESDGYVGPYAAYDGEEAARVARSIDRQVLRRVRWRSTLHRLLGWKRPDRHWRFQMTRNRHLDLPVVARICGLPAIVERVALLFGADLILWRTQFFLQSGKPSEGLGWHRDLYVNLLEAPRTSLSVHLAVTEATEDNCVLILPGTHNMTNDQICSAHGLALVRGRESNLQGSPQFAGAPKRSEAVKRMPLKPGEFFIFNEALAHASSEASNPSRSRIAMGMRVTVPSVRVLPLAFSDTLPKVHRCVMLRGQNHPGLNELLPWPQ